MKERTIIIDEELYQQLSLLAWDMDASIGNLLNRAVKLLLKRYDPRKGNFHN